MGFEELTWEDLEAWAGERVVSRGKTYQGRVKEARAVGDHGAVAWVEGGDRYATVVFVERAGMPQSYCTCPYGLRCKHAVALVLVYLDTMGRGGSLPAMAREDPRVALLIWQLGLPSEWFGLELSEEQAEDVLQEAGFLPPSQPGEPLGRGQRQAAEAVERYLASLEAPALVALVADLATEIPELGARLIDLARIRSGDVDDLVRSARLEIDAVTAESSWQEEWSDEGNLPDYSGVRRRLESLLAAGWADEVVELGEELWGASQVQIELADDDGHSAWEVRQCMAIVLRALEASSLSGPERLLWEIDLRIDDEYGVMDGLAESWRDEDAAAPADWSAVADVLVDRMKAVPVDGSAGDRRGRYDRQRVMGVAMEALERAGRGPEVIPLLEGEAETTRCYNELVHHLCAEGRYEEAEGWARRGYDDTIEDAPGLASRLVESLREIAERRQDPALAAALDAYAFFEDPRLKRFEAVRSTAAPLGLWEDVREGLLSWLETGVRPDEAGKPGKAGPPAWPLPDPELRFRKPRFGTEFPKTDVLIDIAIHEGRPADALRWHGLAADRRPFPNRAQAAKVAEAVQHTHPDDALALWKEIALAHIAQVKPAEYKAAGAILVRMRAVYERTDRMDEWRALLAELRVANARRPRMIEVLDRLEKPPRRILDEPAGG